MKLKLNIFLVLLAVLLFSCLGSNIQEGFGIGRDIANLGDDVGRGIGNLGQGVGNVVGGVAGGVGNVVGGVGRGIGDVVGGVGRGVGDVVGGVGRGVGDVVGGVGHGIDDALGLGYAGDGYYDQGTESYGERYPIEEIEERPRRRRRYNDDWIRKSQIVPPVCPKCPDVRTCRQTPCPPCPPCARCPDPAFTCEKVPNYQSRAWMPGDGGGTGGVSLPRPILGDFSTFGM